MVVKYTEKHNLLDTTEYNVTNSSLKYVGHNLSDITEYNVTSQSKIYRKT